MAELDLVKLAKLLEMLASDQDGEALAAARAVASAVRKSKRTWMDILQAPLSKQAPHQQERDLRRSPEHYRDMYRKAEEELKQQQARQASSIHRILVESILMRAFTVSDEERNFIVGMNRRATFTSEEKKRINEIYNKAFNVKVPKQKERKE